MLLHKVKTIDHSETDRDRDPILIERTYSKRKNVGLTFDHQKPL